MPRVKNTRPTNIYWLYDMRPDTLSEHPQGRPFYCGKTVLKIEYRLKAHMWNAVRCPKGRVPQMLLACGDLVRTELVEVVPADGDWVSRERHWIAVLRQTNPDALNVADGGEGAPGNVQTAAHRALMSEKMKGRVVSAETRAKLRARMLGNPIRKGKKLSPEQSAKMSEARRGKKRGPYSAEHREKIGAAQRGRTFSEDRKAKLRAAWERRRTAHPIKDETRAKISAAHKGRVVSDVHRARLKEAWVRRRLKLSVDNPQMCG